MSGRERQGSMAGVEARLRSHYQSSDPGAVPIGLVQRVAAIPTTIERTPDAARFEALRPWLALAAAAAIVALVIRLAPTSGLLGSGSGLATTFDPTIDGIGLAAPFDASLPWALVIGAIVLLGIWAIGATGWRRLPPALVAVALGGYAAYGTLVPVDLQVSGIGQGLNVSEAALPLGAQGELYYETAAPRQPFSIGLLLLAGPGPEYRIESLADEHPLDQAWVGLRWSSVWIDREPNGGMMGPGRPFTPFTVPVTGQSVWLVGRAGACAVGHAPVTGDETAGVEIVDRVSINVTVFGWPRVLELAIPRLAEADSTPCSADLLPGSSPSATP